MTLSKISRTSRSGLSLIELTVVVTVAAVIALIAVSKVKKSRLQAERRERIRCVSNLKNIGLAFRIFATDNNDQFPPAVMATNPARLATLQPIDVFRFITNELSTPILLHCLADKQRSAPRNGASFNEITTKNISYFASLSASETNPAAFLAGDRNILTGGQPVSGLLALSTNLAPTLSWSKQIHNEKGNLAMGDGSVQQMNSLRLEQSVRDQDLATNHLAFP
ncbi:MAG TPA: prepilin-type N-terminal cleavage/methylation domain-containing protein [Verrucomicrobiae bacterium]